MFGSEFVLRESLLWVKLLMYKLVFKVFTAILSYGSMKTYFWRQIGLFEIVDNLVYQIIIFFQRNFFENRFLVKKLNCFNLSTFKLCFFSSNLCFFGCKQFIFKVFVGLAINNVMKKVQFDFCLSAYKQYLWQLIAFVCFAWKHVWRFCLNSVYPPTNNFF